MHIVLYEPDIPWNTGNVGRTCVATGTTLHLVGKLGFSLSEKEIRRSGLDYWAKLNPIQHAGWDAFIRTLAPDAALFFFSKWGTKDYWDVTYPANSYLVFGCETKGLPVPIRERYADRLVRIPMQPDSVRSLNLSVSAAVALYEALRQQR
jgi:tRNA (cytidine/uridine-2'-O-)-methyltransferase